MKVEFFQVPYIYSRKYLSVPQIFKDKKSLHLVLPHRWQSVKNLTKFNHTYQQSLFEIFY